MSLIEGLLIFIIVILSYVVVVFALNKKGILKKHNISFYGPMLMWRTKKGINFLKKISRRERFWTKFGNFGIVWCFITMIIIVTLFVWNTWAILDFTPEQIEQLPGIEFALVIPVINPLFPLEYIGYIILSLVIAMVVHEFSHGILTFVGKLKVKSLGILYLIFPLGAFCEPDEEQLQKTDPRNRMRIFAAGPTMNFVVVLVSILLLSFVFMSAVQPAADGAGIFQVEEGSPADEVGLKQGMIITNFNDTRVTNFLEYSIALNNTHANQTINITYVQGNTIHNREVILDNMYSYTNQEEDNGKGYLGTWFLTQTDYKDFLSILKNPFINSPDLPFPEGFGLFWIIPLYGYFQGFNPIASPFTDSYIITGPLSFIPQDAFWIIVNALYWIFWLNFAVAIFNVLPMIPLDGGYLFKDALDLIVRRLKGDISEEKREKIIKKISLAISLVILIMIFFPFILKYLAPLF